MMAFSMRDGTFQGPECSGSWTCWRRSAFDRHRPAPGEYFADMRTARAFLQTGIKAPAFFVLTAPICGWNVSGMARQFIAAAIRKTLMRRCGNGVGKDRVHGRSPRRSRRQRTRARRIRGALVWLVEGLAAQTQGWRDPLGKNTELFPV